MSKADKEFLRNLLIESGYGALLGEGFGASVEETPKEEEINPPVKEEKSDEVEPTLGASTDSTQTESKTDKPIQKPYNKTPIHKKPLEKPSETDKTEPPVTEKTPEPSNKSKTQKSKPRPKISEGGRDRGLRYANIVKQEIGKSWYQNTDEDKISIAMRSVDSESAYTFVGQFANVSGGGLLKTLGVKVKPR